ARSRPVQQGLRYVPPTFVENSPKEVDVGGVTIVPAFPGTLAGHLFKERPMRFLAALIPLTLATALSTPVFAAGSMQITGHGEVMAAPDTAIVTSGVTSQGTTAKE